MTQKRQNGGNTARPITDKFEKTTIQAERHIDQTVEGVFIVDMTHSRTTTRNEFIKDFTQGSEAFEELVGKVSKLGNIALTLIVHNGEGVRNLGRFESPKDLAEKLAEVHTQHSGTQIKASLDIAPENADFIIVNGDTTDGDNADALVETVRAIQDKAGRNIPVIPLLETTDGPSGTTQEHRDALKVMAEASGISGAPFDYKTRLSMLDFVAVFGAATRGSEAVQELREKGDIPQEVWDALPEQTLEEISQAHEVDEPEVPAVVENTPQPKTPPQVGRSVKGNHNIVLGDVGDGASVTITLAPPVNPQALPESRAAAPLRQRPKEPKKAGWLRAALVATGVAAVPILAAGGAYLGAQHDHEAGISSVQNPRTQLAAAISSNVLFDTGKADLTQAGIMQLQQVVDAVEMDPNGQWFGQIKITGYASDKGNFEQNEALALQRAEEVAKQLERMGVPAARLSVNGAGVTNQLDGPDAWSQRVELSVG